MDTMPVFLIDGNNFSTLEEFFDEVERVLVSSRSWGRNLDAFNDVLRGGFGTPEGGFVLKWRHSERSRHHLGYDETIRQLQLRLKTSHPASRAAIMHDLQLATNRTGPTVFDWITTIIREHGPGGSEARDGVQLVLE
jgi:RNAse (barnase) inhibitor barstar